ncbi:proton-conducting transporter membrane subunit [Rickettsiales bacterium LUAb2]
MIFIPIFTILIIIGFIIIISNNYHFNRLSVAIGVIIILPINMFYYITSLSNQSISYILNNIYQEDTSFIFTFASSFALAIAIFFSLLYKKINFNEQGLAFVYISLVTAIYCTNNLHTILVLFEALPIIAGFMLALSSNENSQRVALQYLILHVISFSLLAIGLEYYSYYTKLHDVQNIADLQHFSKYIILSALLINLAIFPISFWLIESISIASNQVAIFFVIFTSKVSLFVILKLFLGYQPLLYIGIFMSIYGFVMSLFTPNLKKIIAYSTLQSTGIIFIAMSVKNPTLQGINTFIFVNILYETALLIIAGMLNNAVKHDNLYNMRGILYKHHLAGIPLIVLSLNIIGIPLTGGFIGQSLILSNIYNHNIYIYYFVILVIAGFSLNVGFKLAYLLYLKSPIAKNLAYFKRIKINYLAVVPVVLLLTVIELTYVIYSYFNITINNLTDTYYALNILVTSIILFIIFIPLLNKSEESKIYKLNNYIIKYSYISLEFAVLGTQKKYKDFFNFILNSSILLVKKYSKISSIYSNSKVIIFIMVSFIILGLVLIIG